MLLSHVFAYLSTVVNDVYFLCGYGIFSNCSSNW
jgi:hypothetical protein